LTKQKSFFTFKKHTIHILIPMNTITSSDFLKRAKETHGSKYDYSQTIYEKSDNPISIGCKIHGKFTQSPNSHLMGRGCPTCGRKRAANKLSLSTDEFIRRSNITHSDKYDYSQSTYKNYKSKLTIKCPIHGNFLQSPSKHLNGHGCRKCGRDICGNLSAKTTSKFMNEALKLHKNKYSYKNTIYKNATSKIEIHCPIHGEFFQKPNDHLCGHGCPKCVHRVSIPEKEFLDYYNIPETPTNRQVNILNKHVDGYDDKTHTIYEFLGDYWHGNPLKYNPADMNTQTKSTFLTLYQNTMKKFEVFKKNGYKVNFIWESDWKNYKKEIDKIPTLKIY
jgi:hypothetical protein